MKTSVPKIDGFLTGATIDHISEQIQNFLESLGQERRNIICIRMGLEAILLRWQERFGETAKVKLTAGTKFGRPFIAIDVPGEECNPMDCDEEYWGEFSARMLVNMGLFPEFTYRKGANSIMVKLKKQKGNPMAGLLLAVVSAFVLGFGGLLLPQTVRFGLLEALLTPVCDTFLGALSTVAGPMIFLSVAWSIYGIGDAAMLGRIGKKMLLRFLGMTCLMTAFTLAVLMPFSDLVYSSGGLELAGAAGIIRLLLGIFPSNIFSPFIEGNSLQIILMAVVVGSVLLILGNQTREAALLIEQINTGFQYLMELINRMVPMFIFIALLQLIWSDSVQVILSAWKPVLYSTVCSFVLLFGLLTYICIKEKVEAVKLVQKLLPAFLIGLTTASSSAAYGTLTNTCEKRLGIHTRMVHFGIPLTIALYMPSCAVWFAACSLHFAELYHVEVSPVWIMSAVIVIAVAAIALPPIPGGSIACYTILFLQLGIPLETISIVVVLNAVIDFITTGLDITFGQCELLLQAGSVNMLDRDVLRK